LRKARIIAGIFVLTSIAVSLSHVYQHLRNYTQPRIQKCTIRILLMVPIYALASWLSLRFKMYALYIDLVRDCYEAFVIYSFVSLLIAYAGGEQKLLESLKNHPPMHHQFPFGFLPHFHTDRKFLIYCKRAVLQYVFIKPLTAALAISLDEMGLYEEGSFSLNRGYLYVLIINNISVTFAMYGLLYFYHAIDTILSSIGPLMKLLCIKAVLFLSFWQGMAISIAASFNMIHESAYNSLEQVEVELQDFLICVEMLFASVADRFAYNFEFFKKTSSRTPTMTVLSDVFDPSDVIQDVYDTFFIQNVNSDNKTK